MHAHRSRVENGIEVLGAEQPPWHGFSARGECEFFCRGFAARTDQDMRPGMRQSECGGARGTSRAQNQNARAAKPQFFLERAEHTDIICIETRQPASG